MTQEVSSSHKLLFAIGVNHKTAPVEIREKVYIRDDEMPALLDRLRETLSECVVISTCNRTEIYAVCDSADVSPERYIDLLIDFKDARGSVSGDHFFTAISCSACRQLFDVVTSIDSKIIGDTQILNQVRKAYLQAYSYGSTGKILNQLTQRALKIGKKTFKETSIHKGAISISLAAVGLAVETYGSLQGKSVMVIGAGETAELTAEALINKRVGKITIANRTRLHAEQMLESLAKTYTFNGEVIDFASFKEHLPNTDIVISSTSSQEPVIFPDDIARRDKRILLIDIAVPRDVDPSVGNIANVVLKNIDDLHSIVDANYGRRMADLPRVKKLVVGEMADILMW
jgi:glutamyl-tRNA reductase